ncbi:hypothetical protein JCM1840_005215 [Sporobolomyces johnsonii]
MAEGAENRPDSLHLRRSLSHPHPPDPSSSSVPSGLPLSGDSTLSPSAFAYSFFPRAPASDTLNVAGGLSTEANLRQIAILQALLSRQQAVIRETLTQTDSPASPVPRGLTSFPLPSAPPPTPSILGYPSPSTAMPPQSSLNPRLEGLNHLPPLATSEGAAAGGTSAWLSDLGTVTADELIAAQAQLDLWTATVFSNSSPTLSPPGTSTALQHPDSPARPSTAVTLPPISSLHSVGNDNAPSPFDWSTLYPSFSPPSTSAGLPTPPAPSFALPASQTSPPFSFSSFPFAPHVNVDEHPAASAAAATASPTSSASSTTKSRRPNRSAKASYKAKAAIAASQSSEGESPGSGPGGVARELMTPEELEEDKRKRNTEASARFRAKKKLRDQELAQTSAQLRDRVANLEREKSSLAAENRWLRDIVSEKAEVNPRLLDVLRSTGALNRAG